jgi:hypothetical protein
LYRKFVLGAMIASVIGHGPLTAPGNGRIMLASYNPTR